MGSTEKARHARHARPIEERPTPRVEPRGLAVVFAAIVMVIMLVPFVGMAWNPTTEPVGNEVLPDEPQLTTSEGSFNVDFLPDAGNYFETHFAYRPQVVDAASRAYAKVFNHSVTSQVILGTNGWMYYRETLNDYQGTSGMSNRALYCAAHNLALLQAYCRSQGSAFVFALAPNKNSLYGANMPSYYLAGDSSTVARFNEYLDELGVNYVDMFSLFESQDQILYFKHDTHWNAQGAALAAQALEQAAGHAGKTYGVSAFVAGAARTGDLTSMIFPVSADAVDQEFCEANPVVLGVNDGEDWTGAAWVFDEGSSVEENYIVTEPVSTAGQGTSGSLLMYRDSFANNMIGYLSLDYTKSTFTKLIPYNALLVAEQKPSVVMVERAQRHLPYLAQAAYAMPSPQINGVKGDISTPDGTTCIAGTNGPLVSFSGVLAGSWSDEARVFVRVQLADGTKRTCEAFLLTDDLSDFCYQAYVYATELGSATSVDVIVLDQGALATVYSGTPS